MTQHALYCQLEAKPGMEQEVATFLTGARRMVDDEPDTTAWFAIRMGPRTFAIFDVFDNERGRDAHLAGGAYWLMKTLDEHRKLLDCIASGRSNCVETIEPAAGPPTGG